MYNCYFVTLNVTINLFCILNYFIHRRKKNIFHEDFLKGLTLNMHKSRLSFLYTITACDYDI